MSIIGHGFQGVVQMKTDWLAKLIMKKLELCILGA